MDIEQVNSVLLKVEAGRSVRLFADDVDELQGETYPMSWSLVGDTEEEVSFSVPLHGENRKLCVYPSRGFVELAPLGILAAPSHVSAVISPRPAILAARRTKGNSWPRDLVPGLLRFGPSKNGGLALKFLTIEAKWVAHTGPLTPWIHRHLALDR